LPVIVPRSAAVWRGGSVCKTREGEKRLKFYSVIVEMDRREDIRIVLFSGPKKELVRGRKASQLIITRFTFQKCLYYWFTAYSHDD